MKDNTFGTSEIGVSPDRSNELLFRKGMILEIPIKIKFDKKYLKEKFEKIFKIRKKALTNGIDEREQKLMFDELMDCFDEEES